MTAPPAAGSTRLAGAAAPRRAATEPGRNYGELAPSVLLLLLGLYLILGAGSITVPGSSNTLGPRFFPNLVGAATVGVGGALAVRILRGDQGPPEGARTSTPMPRRRGGRSESSRSPFWPTRC